MPIKLVRKFDKVLNSIDRILRYFCGFLVIFIVISISLNVIMRYFFNMPISWSLEVSEYIMIYITFLLIAWTLNNDGHIRIDIFTSKMKPEIQAGVNVIVYLLSAVVFFILFWFSMQATIDLYVRNVVAMKSIQVPRFIIMLPISIGCLLFLLRSLVRVFEELHLLKTDVKSKEVI